MYRAASQLKHTFARFAQAATARGTCRPGGARSLSSYIKLSSRVKEALANGEPVVALESTIISHGMPYPQNIETAQAVEAIVSKHGSTAATVALIDGRIHIGLEQEGLVRLGKKDAHVVKASRRDIASVLSQRMLGSTTVSGTMIAAHMAGIRIFATGGIGGVHRGAESTMDISADLTELGRTPVTVVCAGAKSILDLPKTLEYLETQGVPVIAYGESTEFPAFFSPRGGLRAPWSLQTPEQVAALVHTHSQLGMQSGQVVAVPIPSEHAVQSAGIERAIEEAVRESEAKGIRGKESTPFLLKRVAELTGGESLTANIALVKNNARVASQIARAFAGMTKRQIHITRVSRSDATAKKRMPKLHPLLVIGGSAIDLMSSVNKSLLDSRPVKHKKNDESEEEDVTSYPGSVLVHVGGVGQNIARAACSLGAKSYLISAIAHDFYGDTIVESMKQAKMPTSFLQCMDNPARTAVCNTFRWTNGKILAAVADMDINDMLSVQHIEKAFKTLKPSVVALDGNIPVPVLSNIVTLAKNKGACIVFEPTSGPKCTKLLSALSFIKGSETNADVSGLVQMITPNKLEAKEMAEAAVRFKLVDSRPLDSMVSKISKDLSSLDAGLIRDALTLFPIFPLQAITLGNKGVAVVSPMPDHSETPSIRHIRARVPDLIINSNGAGDSFVGALLALLYNNQAAALSSDGAIILESKDIDRIVWLAQKASILSLESDIAVSNKLSPALLEEG